MAKGKNTRSGLLWEVERLLNECDELPQVLLMENVPQVHGKKNLEHFQEWMDFLESKGYSNYWKDLNAKNFGIPQNRNRTFMVSVLGDYTYEFPEEFPLELRLKDMLEDSVDERFYISDVALKGFIEHERKQREKGNSFHATIKNKNEIASTIKARYYKDGSDCLIQMGEPTINVVGNYSPSGHDVSRIVDTEGLAPTVKENHGTVTAIAEPLAYDEQNGYIRTDGTVGTLTTDGSSPKHNNRVVESEMRIRKLTPRECWRLMGFDDADFEKAAQQNSASQLYKQAGNSICVDVLYYIFKQML